MRRFQIGGGDDHGLMGPADRDPLQVGQNGQGRMAAEVVGRQVEDPFGHMHADQAVRFLVAVLDALQMHIFIGRVAIAGVQPWRRARVGVEKFRNVVLDGFQKRRQVELEPQPALFLDLLGHEGALALLAADQAFAVQHVDGLADGDAGDSELALQLLDGRDLVPRFPVAGLDAPAQRRCDLKIERNVAAPIGSLYQRFHKAKLLSSQLSSQAPSAMGQKRPQEGMVILMII